MGQNVTFLGDVADSYDERVIKTEALLDLWVEDHNYSVATAATASGIVAFMRFSQTFVDTLRLGNGLKRGGWRGFGQDALRLATAAGIPGAAVSRLSRILVVTQEANVMTCTWVTTVNALSKTGQRYFASIEQLAQAAGVDLQFIKAAGTGIPELTKLVATLKRLGVVVEEIKPASRQVESIVDLMNARPSGALAFAGSWRRPTHDSGFAGPL